MGANGSRSTIPDNARAAGLLHQLAGVLEEQRANPFRVAAYRRAAATVRGLDRSYREILATEGPAGLDRLRGIGPRIALALEAIAGTGRLPMLERLLGERDPESLLASLPFIGRRLAERLHHEFGIGSLEDLESALHRGALDGVRGLGPRRRDALAAIVADRLATGRVDPVAADIPSVAELLDVDGEYRREAEWGRLPTIAPRRFNPEHRAWLPVLHTRRGDRDHTALYSNTAMAHRLGRTHDWVVIYWDGSSREHQATVVTERRGALRGHRVVRGRERECSRYYGVPVEGPAEVGWFEGLNPGEDQSPTDRAAHRGSAVRGLLAVQTEC